MADHREAMGLIKRREGRSYPVLTPNLKGYEAAVCLLIVFIFNPQVPPRAPLNFVQIPRFLVAAARSAGRNCRS